MMQSLGTNLDLNLERLDGNLDTSPHKSIDVNHRQSLVMKPDEKLGRSLGRTIKGILHQSLDTNLDGTLQSPDTSVVPVLRLSAYRHHQQRTAAEAAQHLHHLLSTTRKPFLPRSMATPKRSSQKRNLAPGVTWDRAPPSWKSTSLTQSGAL